jgi:hypothetical protein
MYKITSSSGDVPDREDERFPPSDFFFNPVSLRVVGAAIREASGLTPQTMFQPERERLETTIMWALERLLAGCGAEQATFLNRYRARFEKVMEEIRRLENAGDEAEEAA